MSSHSPLLYVNVNGSNFTKATAGTNWEREETEPSSIYIFFRVGDGHLEFGR